MHPDKPGGHNPFAQSKLDRVPYPEDLGEDHAALQLPARRLTPSQSDG